jgi:hypothetical protein
MCIYQQNRCCLFIKLASDSSQLLTQPNFLSLTSPFLLILHQSEEGPPHYIFSVPRERERERDAFVRRDTRETHEKEFGWWANYVKREYRRDSCWEQDHRAPAQLKRIQIPFSSMVALDWILEIEICLTTRHIFSHTRH